MAKFYKILSMLCFALAIISAVTYAKEDPFLAFVCAFFGIALGITLYEISEIREYLLHLHGLQKDEPAERNSVQTKPLHPIQR